MKTLLGASMIVGFMTALLVTTLNHAKAADIEIFPVAASSIGQLSVPKDECVTILIDQKIVALTKVAQESLNATQAKRANNAKYAAECVRRTKKLPTNLNKAAIGEVNYNVIRAKVYGLK